MSSDDDSADSADDDDSDLRYDAFRTPRSHHGGAGGASSCCIRRQTIQYPMHPPPPLLLTPASSASVRSRSVSRIEVTTSIPRRQTITTLAPVCMSASMTSLDTVDSVRRDSGISSSTTTGGSTSSMRSSRVDLSATLPTLPYPRQRLGANGDHRLLKRRVGRTGTSYTDVLPSPRYLNTRSHTLDTFTLSSHSSSRRSTVVVRCADLIDTGDDDKPDTGAKPDVLTTYDRS